MKKFTKTLLSLLLVLSMVTVHIVTPMSVFASDYVSVTIDVNGGNELENNVITGVPGSTLSEMVAAQDESWILQFQNVRKQRTYLQGVVEASTNYDIDPDNNPIYGDTNIKLIWGNSELYSDNIEIDAEPPVIGDEYSIHEETGEWGIGLYVQNPTPLIGGDGLNFDVFDVPFESRSYLVRTCDDPIEENACFEQFEGEITGDQKYYLQFHISINDNYYMTNDIKDVLTVNGEAPTMFDDIRTYENGDFEGAWVIVEMDAVDEQGGNNGGNEPAELDVTVSPSSVDFGKFTIGSEEDLTRDITISNNSDVEVEVEIQIPFDDGPFNIHAESSVLTIPAKEQETVTLSVDHAAEKASVAGTYSGEFVIDYNEVGVQMGDSKVVSATVVVEEAQSNPPVDPPQPEMVTVTFNTDGGTPAPDEMEIEKGSSITKPETDPYKEGFEFEVWCSDETKTQPYTFGDEVNENLVLYARYKEVTQTGGGNEPAEIDVTIVPNAVEFGTIYIGATEDLTKDVTVTNNSDVAVEITIDLPADGPFNLHEESNTFTLDAHGDRTITLSVDHGAATSAGTYHGEYVFNYNEVGEQLGDSATVGATVVVEEAQSNPPVDPPQPEMVTVTFNTDGGTPAPDEMEIEKGSSITKPETDPYKEGFEFEVWCSDETKTQPYTFGDEVNENLVLYARYKEATQTGGGNEPAEVNITVNPMSVDFGTFTIGSESDLYKTVNVKNDSEVAVEVTISSPTNEGPFYALEIEPFTLQAGEDINVSLIVDHGAQKASVAGNYSGQYVFTYHAVGEQEEDEVLLQAAVVVAEEEEAPLEIIENTDNQNYDPEGENAGDGLTIKVNGELDNLVRIEVDGVEVPEGAVTLTEGSTIATFSADFLSTLGEGAHTVTFIYEEGDVEATFTIGATINDPAPDTTAQETNPGTFDNISSWIKILGVSAIIAIVGTVILKKKHN